MRHFYHRVCREIERVRLMLRVQWRIVRGGLYPFRDCPLWFIVEEVTATTTSSDPYVERYFAEASAELALRVQRIANHGGHYEVIGRAIKGT